METCSFPTRPIPLSIGDINLSVERYALDSNTPLLAKTLCDGSVWRNPLRDLQQTVTLGCRVLPDDVNELSALLYDYQKHHRHFDFTFLGIPFSDMLVSAFHLSFDPDAAAPALSLTLSALSWEVLPS